MKLISIFTTIALTAAPAAWAGSLSTTPAEPMMEPMAEVAPAPYDWSGLYAGLSAGKSTGNFDYTIIGEASPYFSDDVSGKSYGVFGGYNFQNGNFVYGLEVALQNIDADRDTLPESKFKRATDLKLRLGYAFDNTLLYAFAGKSWATWHNESGFVDDYSMDGTNMGIGAETVMWQNWLLGVEYIRRNLDGDLIPDYDETISSDLNTVQIRVGYKF